MTQVTGETDEAVVCVLSVDCSYGGELQHVMYNYRSTKQAELFAGKFVKKMLDEGYTSKIRGVFIKDGNYWKRAGDYYTCLK